MFLELSFDSHAGGKEVRLPNAASSWRYDEDDERELSLDELVSDLRASASSRKAASMTSSKSSPLRMASPPRRSKKQENFTTSRCSAGCPRSASPSPKKKKIPVRTARNFRDEDQSEDENAAVMPTPRLDRILKQRPTMEAKRCTPAATSTRPKGPAPPVRKSKVRSPVLSLSSPSLSPLTNSSEAASPLSVSEDIYMPLTPDEDSIDALIGKDIRDLNKLISKKAGPSKTKTLTTRQSPVRSPTANEISKTIRQSTRFRKGILKKTSQEDSRIKTDRISVTRNPSLRFPVPVRKPTFDMLESPPPPPPPDSDEDEEEDSFAEEIRKLREARRLALSPTKSVEPTPPNKTTTDANAETESAEICATVALKVRNASNAINGLLLEALKPFEDRQKEAEQTKELEDEKTGGDEVLRNAAAAELKCATQTIVSQLDLTFADMTERRNADLKAEADATAAAKDAEKKEKEAAEEKKKAAEKEAKERDMEVLRLIPMRGKLLTCSSDIEHVLEHLESEDAKECDTISTEATEVETLRNLTRQRIQRIEARLAAAPTSNQPTERGQSISWRTVDWVRDTFAAENPIPSDRGNYQTQEVETPAINNEFVEDQGPFQEVLQRQVMEKLDLTMLKLKHVLDIDMKEAAEAQEKRKRDQSEQDEKQRQQKLEDERKQQALDDADNARRRVMGLTSIEDVEGWMEEGRHLQRNFRQNSHLEQLMNTRIDAEGGGLFTNGSPSNQMEALRQFDSLMTTIPARDHDELPRYSSQSERRASHRRDTVSARRRRFRDQQPSELWIETSSSDSEVEESDANSSFDTREVSPVPISRKRFERHTRKNSCPVFRPQQPSPKVSPPRTNKLYSRHRSRTSPKLPGIVNQNESTSSTRRTRNRKDKSVPLETDFARTIQALQAERRQKTSWVRNHNNRGGAAFQSIY